MAEPDPRDWIDPRTAEERATRRRQLEVAALRSAVEALEAAPVTMKGRAESLARAMRSLVSKMHSGQ
jgi:hypothetical protein